MIKTREEIKIILTKENKTQTWLAEQLGISSKQLSNKLGNNTFKLNEFDDMLDILGKAIFYI